MITMNQLRTIKQDTPKACLRNGVHISLKQPISVPSIVWDGIFAQLKHLAG